MSYWLWWSPDFSAGQLWCMSPHHSLSVWPWISFPNSPQSHPFIWEMTVLILTSLNARIFCSVLQITTHLAAPHVIYYLTVHMGQEFGRVWLDPFRRLQWWCPRGWISSRDLTGERSASKLISGCWYNSCPYNYVWGSWLLAGYWPEATVHS